MDSSRQLAPGLALFGGIAPRTLVRLTVAALLATPFVGVRSQPSGNGFMFHRPYGTLALRGGYTLANTASQPFTLMRSQTTIGSRSFDAMNLGLDLGFHATRRLDVVFSIDGSAAGTTAEYRKWEENGQPIQHTSTLDHVTLGGSLRYNLTDRGRPISAFAWIPARCVPYFGIGGGLIGYQLTQKGDFVEETVKDTAAIYTDELQSSNWGPMAQVFSGLDYRINARWLLLGEARYTRASAKLIDDYVGLGRIDLSGMTINFGTRIRF